MIQQLQAQLDAARNAPLCSDLEASSDPVDTESVSSGSVAECDAEAGFDLNARTAFVTPCEAATLVRITFDDPNQGTSEVVTSSGSTVNVAIPNGESNFSFIVFVGSQEATSGSVTYPEDPKVITNTVSCPVQASLTLVQGQQYHVSVDACDEAIVEIAMLASGVPVWSTWARSHNFYGGRPPDVRVRVVVSGEETAKQTRSPTTVAYPHQQ